MGGVDSLSLSLTICTDIVDAWSIGTSTWISVSLQALPCEVDLVGSWGDVTLQEN